MSLIRILSAGKATQDVQPPETAAWHDYLTEHYAADNRKRQEIRTAEALEQFNEENPT